MIWMWAVNLAYLALAMGLNLWDTVPMRRIRARVMGRGAV
jgi:lipopolysaccharide export system permease protein